MIAAVNTMPRAMVARCARIADSTRFQGFIFAVIVVNAIALGLGTYDSIEDDAGTLLTVISEVCVGIFVIELAIRITAYGRRPQDFFRDGWNVFDFVVITAAFIPGVRESTTLLRLAAPAASRPHRHRPAGAPGHRPRMARSLPRWQPGPARRAADVRLRDGRLDPLPRGGSRELGRTSATRC